MVDFIRNTLRINSLYPIYSEIGRIEYNRLFAEPSALKATVSSAHNYDMRMNLYKELRPLGQGKVIWDVGCGTAQAISELQHGQSFRGLRFAGVDYMAGQLFGGRLGITLPRVPIIEGLIENLESVDRRARQIEISSPDVIIFSNSLYHCQQFGTLDLMLKGAHRVLADDGVVLIYSENGIDSPDDSLPLYREIGEVNHARNIGFDIQILRGNGAYCDYYMRLTKER